MIDTIKIANLIKDFPHSEADFWQMGWRKKYDQAGNFHWWFQERKNSRFPYMSIYESPIGEIYLWMSVSLPAFVLGSNAVLLTEDEVPEALESLSVYISERSGVSFNAKRAKIWSIDFAKDFFIGEESIRAVVLHLSKIQIPRFKAGLYSGTTCYFHSSGSGKERAKPRTVCFYGKHEDAIAKKFPPDDIERTRGILRAEFRYRNKRAVKRLCKKLGLPGDCAETLLTKKISDSVLSSIEKNILDLDLRQNTKIKIQLLLDKFGGRRARALIAFLTMRDEYGDNFYKIQSLEYSKSNYQACLRDCRSAGVWSLRDLASDL